MAFNEEHPQNVAPPIEVTLLGIDIDVNDKQLKNAKEPIEIIPSGIIIDLSERHPLKAYLSIIVTPLGIFMAFNDEQLEYLQPVITQYFVRNKSEICHRPLRVHSKG